MMRAATILAALGAIGAALFLYLTAPAQLAEAPPADHAPDLANGERMFLIGGCASCHAEKGAEGEARLSLGGGQRLASPFGIFVAPNISPGPDGIEGWSLAEFAAAMTLGVSPDGRHYYPAFPYASYARMSLADVVDLKGYLDTLPPVARENEPHELSFPFSISRGVGFWKLLNLDPAPVVTAELSPDAERGRYLIEGPGHCGECHTPRDAMGGLILDKWLSGAPNLEGPGAIPNLTPHEEGLASWSAEDIAYYLESGFRPDFDTAGGAMVDVIRNTSQLAPEDRAAIAAYLKAIPALPDGHRG